MKTKKSAGLAIIYDNKILLAHTTSRGWYGSYGIPKGGIDDGESKLDAAIRETREEVGINIPKKLIDPTEYTFTVSTKKYGHKIVYYYIVKIDDLSQIGLKDLRVPKKQLQVEEVDWAGFLDYKEAMKRVMKSQISLVNNLVGKGLLEKKQNILNFKRFGDRL
jgi:8-oxo-dGTP pyrophosphatase MutT (NUDIX family)